MFPLLTLRWQMPTGLVYVRVRYKVIEEHLWITIYVCDDNDGYELTSSNDTPSLLQWLPNSDLVPTLKWWLLHILSLGVILCGLRLSGRPNARIFLSVNYFSTNGIKNKWNKPKLFNSHQMILKATEIGKFGITYRL